MTTGRTLMLAGLGGVGYETLKNLCGDPRIDRIVAADINEPTGTTRTHAATYHATLLGRHPRVTFTTLDLLDHDAVTRTLETIQPDVVFAAATILRYAPFEELPAEDRNDLIGFGPEGPGYACILPGQLPLVHTLLRAATAADIPTPPVVNASLPDIVNPILHHAGHTPLTGTGNIGQTIPPIAHAISETHDLPLDSLDIYFVMGHPGAHGILFHRSTKGVPYHLTVLANGTPVPDIDLDAALTDTNRPFPTEPSPREVSIVTGAVSARILTALLTTTPTRMHAPGPNGLVGGYPVRISRSDTTIVLPPGLTQAEAERINHESLPFEGIERIEDDGTTVLTDTAHRALRDVLNVDVKCFSPHEALEITEHIIHGYQALARRHGIEPKLHVTW